MDFKVDTCLGCKKMMKFARINLCDECKELYLQKIKDYLKDNNNANGYAIAKALKISPKIIEYFIQDGSLVNVNALSKDKYDNLKELQTIKNKMRQSMEQKNVNDTNKNDVRTLFLSNIKKR